MFPEMQDECEECGMSLEFEYGDQLGLLCDSCLDARNERLGDSEAMDFAELQDLGGEG